MLIYRKVFPHIKAVCFLLFSEGHFEEEEWWQWCPSSGKLSGLLAIQSKQVRELMPAPGYLSAVKSPTLLGPQSAFSLPVVVFPPVIEMLTLRALCAS